jgi:hypothetical protein
MDERFHECATSSSIAHPSAGPTKIFATTTPDCVSKPYSTPRCDEYLARNTSYPTTNGIVSTPWKSSGLKYPPN